MEASAAVEASTAVESTTKARLPTFGKASGGSPMIKATERAGVGAGLAMGCESMLAPTKSSFTSTMKSASMKSTGATEVVAIDENSAVGYIAMVVEHDPVMPIVPPV